MVNTITLKELRPNLPKVVEDMDTKLDRFIITKHGKPVAVMMSIDDYEGLLETLEIMSDSELIKSIKKSEKELAKGGGTSLAELKKRMDIV